MKWCVLFIVLFFVGCYIGGESTTRSAKEDETGGIEITVTFAPADPWIAECLYPANFRVLYDYITYRSLKNVNLRHRPDESPDWWMVIQ